MGQYDGNALRVMSGRHQSAIGIGVTDVLIAVKRKEQNLIKTCLAIKFGRARKK